MKKFMLSAVAAALCGLASAKLPAPVLDDAAKAKAAEAAARTAWQAKVDAFQLCRAQDQAVAYMRSHPVNAQAVKTVAMAPAGGTGGAPAAGAPAARPAPAGTSAATAPAAPAAATPPPATAVAAAQPAANPGTGGAPAARPNAAEGGGTPTTAGTARPTMPSCLDPGPFAYAPPAQKPLETAGAHSPAPTATSPPSVRAESATMTPTKPSTATKP